RGCTHCTGRDKLVLPAREASTWDADLPQRHPHSPPTAERKSPQGPVFSQQCPALLHAAPAAARIRWSVSYVVEKLLHAALCDMQARITRAVVQQNAAVRLGDESVGEEHVR